MDDLTKDPNSGNPNRVSKVVQAKAHMSETLLAFALQCRFWRAIGDWSSELIMLILRWINVEVMIRPGR